MLERNRGRFAAISRAYAQQDADDLLQEVLLQIWRSFDRFEERSSLDTWCYRVALNTAISWRRSIARRKNVLPRDSTDVELLARRESVPASLRSLEQCLQTLSHGDRAIVLMYLDDMSSDEMAEVLGVSVGALRVRVHRLKARINEWEIGDT
jgi:RNA polymerase sigma-70 factor, ECF subfamily